MLRWIGSFWKFGLVAILAAFVGAFITAMFMPGMAAPSGWADVMTAMFTFLGLIFAVSAFFTWKKSKIRDDGYEAAKAYVNAVVELDEAMIAAIPLLTRVMAIEGMVPPSGKEAVSVAAGLKQDADRMRAALQRVTMRREEMGFWNVKLTPKADVIHEELHMSGIKFCVVLSQFSDSCENVHVYGNEDVYPTLPLLTDKADALIISLNQAFKQRQELGMASLYIQV